MNLHRRRRSVTAYGALILTTLGWSCDRSPVQPSLRPAPGSQAVTTVNVEILPPGAVAPGAPVKLRAIAVRSDSSTEDVSDRVIWTSGDARIVQVTPDGIATGVQVGEARVNGRYESGDGTRYASAPLLVLVPGTFKLGGRITDSGAPIPQATVSVISGVGEGLSTSTGPDGSYALFGIAGTVRLQAKRDGFLNQIEQINVAASIAHDFAMAPDRARMDVSGSYTLSLDMGTCEPGGSTGPGNLPQRRYNAVVTQRDARLTVTLSGAAFIVNQDHGNRFTGTIDPLGQVTFMIGDPYDSYLIGPMDLVEQLNPTDAFVVWGSVDARATASTIAGVLSGYLMITDPNAPTFFSASTACFSNRHAFELRRQ
jgi:hypothetical protein